VIPCVVFSINGEFGNNIFTHHKGCFKNKNANTELVIGAVSEKTH
jgi:hypothetical protein